MPFISDLLFVKASRLELDPVVESIATLTGAAHCEQVAFITVERAADYPHAPPEHRVCDFVGAVILLKRSNAKTPAYKVLPEKYGIEAFTPLKWILAERAGKTDW